jgi:hypothetical protein
MGWVGRTVLLVEFVDFGFGNDVACETLMHGFFNQHILDRVALNGQVRLLKLFLAS